jgi:Flp pilus assembly CpaE family ATPase
MLDQCDLIFLIVQPELASIAAASRWFSVFTELEYAQEKVIIVGNRTGGKSKMMDEQMHKTFGELLAGKIPNAYALAESSAITGAPMAVAYPRESYSKAIKSVNQLIERKLAQQARDEVKA